MPSLLNVARRRPVSVGTALLGVILGAIYLAVIIGQGDRSILEVLPWVLLMISASLAAGVSALTGRPRVAQWIMVLAVLIFALLGIAMLPTLGIGFILIAAIGLAAIGEARAAR